LGFSLSGEIDGNVWRGICRSSMTSRYACHEAGRPRGPGKLVNIVVAGGETQGAWKMISGSLRATVSIDAWR
jgi:hypothetical protein